MLFFKNMPDRSVRAVVLDKLAIPARPYKLDE